MKTNKYQAVLFDFGGTLDSDGLTWKERFYPIYLKAGLNWNREEFNKRFYASDDYLCEKKLRDESYLRTLTLQVSLVLQHGNINDEKLAAGIAQSFLDDSLAVLRRNKGILEKLKMRYRLGIVSNFYGNLPSLCAEAGISGLFGAIVDSACVGFLKPDPKIFACALEKLGTEPQKTLFVGDSISRDLQGAKAAGMDHVWLRSAASPDHLKPCCPDDKMIGSVLELESILLQENEK